MNNNYLNNDTSRFPTTDPAIMLGFPPKHVISGENKKIDNPFWKDLITLVTGINDGKSIKELLPQIMGDPLPMDITRYVPSIEDAMTIGSERQNRLIRTEILLLLRDYFVKKYSWSITATPYMETVAASLGPNVIEMGAGNGYWAFILSQLGCKVQAFDQEVPENPWHPIIEGNPDSICSITDHSLLLCWPEYYKSIATDTLKNFLGNKLVYVGEWMGCTADESFHELLEQEWECIMDIPNVSYPYIRDRIMTFKRK